MTLKEVQDEVHKWASQFNPAYWKPHEIFARLGEEVGELGREINHIFGPKKKKPEEDTSSLEEESGDIIFTLACLANSKGFSLEQAFKRSMDKCWGRDNERYKRKEE